MGNLECKAFVKVTFLYWFVVTMINGITKSSTTFLWIACLTQRTIHMNLRIPGPTALR